MQVARKRRRPSSVVASRRHLLPQAGEGGALRPRTAGFLLTETLATFTISAFVLLGLVSSASVLLRAVDRSVARVETVDDLGRAMAAIARDVAQIRRARWNGLEPQAFVFRGGHNSLFFARRTRAAGGTPTMQVVALREIAADGGPRLTRGAARLSSRATSFDDLVYEPQREIWTGAARLRFAYVPLRRGQDTPAPRDSWPVGREMPEAILIQAIDRQTRRVLLTSRVTIAADADIGCVDTESAGTGAGAAAAGGTTTQASTEPGGSGGVDFGPLPQPEKLPDAVTGPGAASPDGAQADASAAFCGRPDVDTRPKTGAPGGPGGVPQGPGAAAPPAQGARL